MSNEVTFGDFAALSRRRGWTLPFLSERFRGTIEQPAELFGRVLQGQYAAVAIPFDSVLAFYRQELAFHRDTAKRERLCACGCGAPVFDRKKWASAACRKRSQRMPTRTAFSASLSS